MAIAMPQGWSAKDLFENGLKEYRTDDEALKLRGRRYLGAAANKGYADAYYWAGMCLIPTESRWDMKEATKWFIKAVVNKNQYTENAKAELAKLGVSVADLASMSKCPQCNGTGLVPNENYGRGIDFQRNKNCPKCNGIGYTGSFNPAEPVPSAAPAKQTIADIKAKAQAGDADAQYNLALYYVDNLNGYDNPNQDEDAYLDWLEKAAANGQKEAQEELAELQAAADAMDDDEPAPATPSAPPQSSGESPQALKTRSDGSFDLIGTVWALEHGDGNRFTFLEGGVVKHSLSDNNSWDQKGNSLTIKRDDGYLIKMEVVDSYTMKGTRKYKGDIFPSKMVLKRKS